MKFVASRALVLLLLIIAAAPTTVLSVQTSTLDQLTNLTGVVTALNSALAASNLTTGVISPAAGGAARPPCRLLPWG